MTDKNVPHRCLFMPDCGVQALLLATGSIQAALPIIAAIFTGVIACWIRAVSILHNTIKVLLWKDYSTQDAAV